MKLNFHLLSAAAFAPLASAKEYETVFTFKKDFYLKFEGLSVGMSPHQGDALIAGLDDNVEAFKTTWTNKITDLGCDLAGVSIIGCFLSHCDVSLHFLIGSCSLLYIYIYRTSPHPSFPIAIGSIQKDTTLPAFRWLVSVTKPMILTFSASSTRSKISRSAAIKGSISKIWACLN